MSEVLSWYVRAKHGMFEHSPYVRGYTIWSRKHRVYIYIFNSLHVYALVTFSMFHSYLKSKKKHHELPIPDGIKKKTFPIFHDLPIFLSSQPTANVSHCRGQSNRSPSAPRCGPAGRLPPGTLRRRRQSPPEAALIQKQKKHGSQEREGERREKKRKRCVCVCIDMCIYICIYI